VVISGWLVGFSDFQRNLRFGSKLAERIANLRKKADFLRVLSCLLCFVDSKTPIHDYPSRVHIEDIFALSNKRVKPVKISPMLQVQINYDERGNRETLTGHLYPLL